MRRDGTLESEDGERLEAHAGGGRLCHTGMMNPYTEIGRADTHTPVMDPGPDSDGFASLSRLYPIPEADRYFALDLWVRLAVVLTRRRREINLNSLVAESWRSRRQYQW